MKHLINILLTLLIWTSVTVLAASDSSTESMNPTSESDDQIKEGIYNYYADAALFRDCKDGKTYSVAMAGDNIALEKSYLEMKAGDNAKMWIRVKGRLIEQPAIEGDKMVTALRVNQLIDMRNDKMCGRNSEPSLSDTPWHLIEVVWTKLAGDTQLEKAVLNFSAEGELSGSTGCNRLNGSYTLTDSSLAFGPMMATRRACPGNQGELEIAVETALSRANGFEISKGVLQLRQDGVPLLRYKSQ